MSKINRAVHDLHYIDDMSAKDGWLNHIHPLAKLLVTIWYIVLTVSFDKYDLAGLAGMCLYPAALMILGEIPAGRAFAQLRVILLLVCLVGIANPFVDRAAVLHIGIFTVTGGMISMLTLILKAGFAVFASYLLAVTTPIENICYALQMLHVPKLLVTLVMLICRYIILMLKEAERVSQAYAMRAPDQRGIHYKVWGTLAGQMLLRSMDRAELVHESMTLRGFDGAFFLRGKEKISKNSVRYGILWSLCLLGLRVFPVFDMVGRILIG